MHPHAANRSRLRQGLTDTAPFLSAHACTLALECVFLLASTLFLCWRLALRHRQYCSRQYIRSASPARIKVFSFPGIKASVCHIRPFCPRLTIGHI